jgi:hypothetical protein
MLVGLDELTDAPVAQLDRLPAQGWSDNLGQLLLIKLR